MHPLLMILKSENISWENVHILILSKLIIYNHTSARIINTEQKKDFKPGTYLSILSALHWYVMRARWGPPWGRRRTCTSTSCCRGPSCATSSARCPQRSCYTGCKCSCTSIAELQAEQTRLMIDYLSEKLDGPCWKLVERQNFLKSY